MDEFSDIWIEQCEAARDIREAWGPKKALGYLIGEKLFNHIRAADSRPEWAEKLPLFVAEIKRIFTADELRRYFATTTRVGPAGHVASDEAYETMRDGGMFDDDVISGAADAILFERARASRDGTRVLERVQTSQMRDSRPRFSGVGCGLRRFRQA